jgi:plasmid stabilization system protein ParE
MGNPDFPIVWSPESETDLFTVWHWGAARFSADTADAHLRDIKKAISLLRTSPFMGSLRDDLLPGVRALVVYPTIVFYRVMCSSVLSTEKHEYFRENVRR